MLSVRRLSRRMGLEHLVEAAAAVMRERSDALFLIAGSGHLIEMEQPAALARLIASFIASN